MFLSDVSIRRPVFATILNLVLIVFGIFTYSKLGVELIPSIDFPVITVSVVYPGADPESVEQKIIKPMEKTLNGIEGLDRYSAFAVPSLGQVTMVFKLGVNSQKAAQDVRDKLGLITFPDEARTPTIFKLDMGAAPVLTYSLSTSNKEVDLAALAKDRIKPALEQVEGVGSVDIVGLREREFHIKISREKLQAFGISPMQIAQAIQGQSLDVPSGKIENSEQVIRIRTEGVVKGLDEIRQMIIPMRNGQKLRVEDIGTVIDTLAEEESYATYNGDPALVLLVRKQSGGNTVAIAKGARQKVADLKSGLPKGTELNLARDSSVYIESSLDSVKIDLVLGALLAVIIVFFFLHDWRATLISAMAIPTAVIGTISFMYSFGFTLNMITSLALTLSIGILVDDAIVVIENIYRRLQLGDTPWEAARKGTAEIGLAALAITLSIVSVFGPVAYMEGIIGRFFYSFGVTIAVAVLLSLFVAFTLTPMLGSRLLKEGHGEPPSFLKPIARGLKAVDDFYRAALQITLAHRWKVVFTGIGVLVITMALFRLLPVSFFPKEDQSELSLNYKMREGTSLAAAKREMIKVDDWMRRKVPGIASTIMTIGSNQEKKANQTNFSIKLVPKQKRSFSQTEMSLYLREALTKKFVKPGESIEVSEAGMGGGGQKAIQLILMGNDYNKLFSMGRELREELAKQPGVVDANTSEPPLTDEFRLVVDPTRAADLGMNTAQIGTAVRSLYEGIKVGVLDDKGLEYDIRLKMDSAGTENVESLAGLSIPNSMGIPIPLANVATLTKAPAPSKIERFSGMRSLTISANYTGKDLQKVTKFLEKETRSRIPADMTFSTEGQGRMMMESLLAFVKTLLLAVVLVYMVLAAQFESYLTPFVIMLSVTLSFVGAILGLLLMGREFSMFSMIGILLLVGIVTKNAILLIDFTLQRMRSGMNVHDALLDAGPTRLRPILMTTFAMIFGMIPIAIGHGEGGEARAPMAVAVIGGLITSTILTLIVIPSVFSLFQGLRARVGGQTK